MEGNACYKFSTIKHFVTKTQALPISRIVEIGVNVGNVTLMMHDYFREAQVVGFEAVREYWEVAHAKTKHLSRIKLHHRAVTYQHVYSDDLGKCARCVKAQLRILKGLPSAGPGWIGGSFVVPSDHELINQAGDLPGFQLLDTLATEPITLEEIIASTGFEEIDLLKMDCEGCENSVLGCAPSETLRCIRFIVGEYHDIQRFYRVVRGHLYGTHKVNLVGDRRLGAFFAERLDGTSDGILRFNKVGMYIPRPQLCEETIDWHIFNEEYVLPGERYWHGLPG